MTLITGAHSGHRASGAYSRDRGTLLKSEAPEIIPSALSGLGRVTNAPGEVPTRATAFPSESPEENSLRGTTDIACLC